MAREYRMVHDSLLMRYLMDNFPFGTYKVNVRLGSIREEVEKGIPEKYAGILKVYKLIADAIVFWEGKVRIIECVVRGTDWWKMNQLELYERAFKTDEEFKQYWDWPIEKILLTTETDPFMEKEAERKGVKVVKYTAPDIEYYKGSLRKREAQSRGLGLEPIE
jgi:hypothetical protein